MTRAAAIEREFDLAKSGHCRSVSEIIRRLPVDDREAVETHLAQPTPGENSSCCAAKPGSRRGSWRQEWVESGHCANEAGGYSRMMEMDELRRRLSDILAAEEREPPDWLEVGQLTSELQAQVYIDATPEIVHHYLDDADIRASDAAYGDRQRRLVRRFVDTGDYAASTPVPWWTCVLVLALVVGLIGWLVS